MYRFFLAASSFTPLSGAAVITNLFQLFAHLVLLKWPFPPHCSPIRLYSRLRAPLSF